MSRSMDIPRTLHHASSDLSGITLANAHRSEISLSVTHISKDLESDPVGSRASTIKAIPYVSEKQLREAPPEKQSTPDPYLVTFTPGDPEDPKNWGRTRRWLLTSAASLLIFNSSFASSSPSGIMKPMIEQFGFSNQVGAFAVSLFVAGYCFGPLLWGPLSEQYGRRPIFIISFVGYTAFQIGDALAPKTLSMLLFRFLGGAFAACPLTNSGALMADIWDAETRGKALALFCIAPIAGPALAPAIAGSIAISGVSWRWLYWVLACFAGLCLIIISLFIPETYAPVLLARKARRLREETGDERYYAAFERRHVSFSERARIILAKPFVLLCREPMLMAITAYMGFFYGCVYLLFEAYPIVFTHGHRMNAGASGLMFVPVIIGSTTTVVLYLIFFERRYRQKIQQYKPNTVPPEERLRFALWGGPLFVIALFWFGWTSFPSISFWAPMMSGIFTGASITMGFLSLLTYIIEAYLVTAASALAGVTVVRSLTGACFPMFAEKMYTKLNPHWASTLLGFLALVMTPIPFVLFRYGATLRSRSKYAPTP